MSASSSIIYKIDSDNSFFVDDDTNIDNDNYGEVLVTIQNNLVDLHTLGTYILLSVSILIGVGVILCWRK